MKNKVFKMKTNNTMWFRNEKTLEQRKVILKGGSIWRFKKQDKGFYIFSGRISKRKRTELALSREQVKQFLIEA